ncbi:hypothetical protein PGTUg99_026961 [Puccinia graminis f. sp. tritici]|uniref:Uncharacterized protein n=1 Tax=Puccinia graminis f. sp. tritici TaxID=56615 RepID=A0A5B0RVG9_PUCGR|nr:hypothetical protein PGTUg99_026961 [Puccinia graminis f. sp. tritici]
MPLSEGKIVERLTELMKLDGMAGSHIRVLSNLRSFYVAKYITRFREVHRLFPLPNWIYLLADPGDRRPHDTEVFEFDGPGLGDDATFPAHRQQGNCMAHEHEAMDEDVASQGPDSTQDEIHHDQEMDLTSNGALINARLPLPRTPTPPPLQKGRAIEPAPQGGAGLIARPSESCFRGKTGFRGAGR